MHAAAAIWLRATQGAATSTRRRATACCQRLAGCCHCSGAALSRAWSRCKAWSGWEACCARCVARGHRTHLALAPRRSCEVVVATVGALGQCSRELWRRWGQTQLSLKLWDRPSDEKEQKVAGDALGRLVQGVGRRLQLSVTVPPGRHAEPAALAISSPGP